MVQFDEESDGCRASDDNWVILMYILSICCLLYGWIYVILLCCGLTSLPLIAIFWCCYRNQLNNMRGEMGVQNRRQNPTDNHQANVAPADEVNKVIGSLKSQLFAESNRKAESCIICMDKFRADDIVAEASCNARHVFHSLCLNEWLRQRLICPLCKDPLEKTTGRRFHQRVGAMLNCFRRRQ